MSIAKGRRALASGLGAAATIAEPVLAPAGLAQPTTLRDQLIGTWIYVSSEAHRDDGTPVPRPQLRGAVTYTADGRFHFITTRSELPNLASNDSTRPSAEEAMVVASGSI